MARGGKACEARGCFLQNMVWVWVEIGYPNIFLMVTWMINRSNRVVVYHILAAFHIDQFCTWGEQGHCGSLGRYHRWDGDPNSAFC